MTRHSGFAIAMIAVGMVPPRLAGQEGVEGLPMAIVREAAGIVADSVPQGRPVVLDARFACDRNTCEAPFEIWPAADAAAVRGILRAVVGRRSDHVVCEGTGPRGCRVIGGVTIVEFRRPAIVGDSATITVSVTYGTDSERAPVVSKSWAITVIRDEASRWRATTMQLVRIS